jgi:hypothetical protein
MKTHLLRRNFDENGRELVGYAGSPVSAGVRCCSGDGTKATAKNEKLASKISGLKLLRLWNATKSS